MAELTPAQCRAGRALLAWSQKTLAPHATVASFELGIRPARDVASWRSRMEQAGVEFIPGGARLRETTR